MPWVGKAYPYAHVARQQGRGPAEDNTDRDKRADLYANYEVELDHGRPMGKTFQDFKRHMSKGSYQESGADKWEDERKKRGEKTSIKQIEDYVHADMRRKHPPPTAWDNIKSMYEGVKPYVQKAWEYGKAGVEAATAAGLGKRKWRKKRKYRRRR